MTMNFPIPKADFIGNYQETKPFLMRAAADVRSFSWQDANSIISRSDISSDDFKILLDGVCEKHKYVEQYIDVGISRNRLIKPVIYDWLRSGATIVANKIIHEEKIQSFSKSVATYTGRRTINSLYVAFGTKESSRPHWDTRDVFAIQLIGRKKWTIFNPTFDSPLYIHPSRDYELSHPCPTEPYLETILEAGDVLYIPRGWWHHPTSIGTGTCHLAIGTFPAYALDYLNWVLSQMPIFSQTRQSLKGWELDENNIREISDSMSSFLCDKKNYNIFLDHYSAYIRDNSQLAINVFGDPNRDTLNGKSNIRIAADIPHDFDRDYIYSNGTKLNLNEKSRRLLSTIAESPGINLDQLASTHPDMEREKIFLLVHNLCHQDILEFVTS